MARLIDRLLARTDSGRPYYSEQMASGAAQWLSVGDMNPNRERGGEWDFARICREVYAANGIVFALIAARQLLFSEARFCFQRLNDKTIYGNENLRVLEYPWRGGTTGELLARMEQDVSLAGNSFIRKVQADGEDRLVRMRPDMIIIVSREEEDDAGRTFREVIGYAEDPRMIGGEGDPEFYPYDEVAHWSPYPDPLASFRGMSWLTPIIREVRADQSMTGYKTSHLDSGATPGIILKYQQKLSDKSLESLKARFAAKYSGPENAGKTLVLDEGADLTVAGSTLEQLQFTSLQSSTEVRIAMAAGVPPIVAGMSAGLESSTYSNYEQSMRRFVDLTMRPNWRTVCASLEHLVPDVPPKGVRLWFDVSDIAALRQGEMERGQTLLVKAQAVAAFVTAGYSRESAVAAVESMDLAKLQEAPGAAAPGTAPGRPPQLGQPEPGQPQVTAQPLPDMAPGPRPAELVPRVNGNRK